jgi:hypothetical protein
MRDKKGLEDSVNYLIGTIDERVEGAYSLDDNHYKKGANLTVCKKLLKRELFDIYCSYYREELDLTYDLTKRLAYQLLGRGVSTRHILENYATQYRKSKSINHNTSIDSIIYNHFGDFNYYITIINSKFKAKLLTLRKN